MKYRVIFFIVATICMGSFSPTVFLVLLPLGVYYAGASYELLVISFLADMLYTLPSETFYGIPLFYTVVTCLLLYISRVLYATVRTR